MKLPETTWSKFANLIKSQVLSKFDPSVLLPTDDKLREPLNISHKGFYISIRKPDNTYICRSGFLEDNQKNILDSGYKAVEAAYTELQAKNIPHKSLLTSSFIFTAVWDVIFDNNGLAWNENDDGVYLSWGDRYKGMYLSHEIRQMNVPRIEIMNRLCSYQCGIPSNFWRLPEMLVSRIVADTYYL